MNILDRILAYKREEVAQAKKEAPLTAVRKTAEQQGATRSFLAAIQQPTETVHVIAEVKKASPSKGVIRADFQPTAIAEIYEKQGASVLSVLTDKHFFQGDPAYLRAIRATVSLPLMMKEFIIDPYQLYQARGLGADAVLLIAAALEREQLQDFLQLARNLSLDVLLEVHNQKEWEIALTLEHPLIGINNRDLTTFHTDIQTTLDLIKEKPKALTIVSESGINSFTTCQRLAAQGVQAVLVGEHLMRAHDIGAALQALLGKTTDGNAV